jgi:transposase
MSQPGRATSIDLRERVVAAYKTGRFSYRSLAELLGIGSASVNRYLRLHRETGGVEPRPHGGGARPVLTEFDRRRLRSLIERHPDWTTFELRDALNEARRSKPVSRSTIVRALAALGYTRKKSLSSPKSATRRVSSSGDETTSRRSRRSPPTVLFIWTRPAQPSR